MITTKDVNMFNRTFEKARRLKQFYFESNSRIVVASLSRGNRILVYGKNSYTKSHPATIQTKPNVVITKHAEVDVINRFMNLFSDKDISNYSICVVSLTHSVKPNLSISSKPCESCMPFIKQSGIKRILYHEFYNDIRFSINEILLG